MDVFSQLGIDWRLLIAQVVNIVILLFLLHRFLYKPILKALDSRQIMVAASVKKAEEIEVRFKETAAQQQQVLVDARMQAQEIIGQARLATQAQHDAALEKTKTDVAEVVKQARAQIEAERTKMISEASGELADLVLAATKKIAGDMANEQIDRALIQKAVDGLKNAKI
ncbi:MAG: F0F1 ATP synthase subunit B [Patescibacteria group bacterium]